VAAAKASRQAPPLPLLLENFDVALGILGGNALDFVPGVVLGVALDEDDFGAFAQFRGAEDGGLDVAGLVARGDDDGAGVVAVSGHGGARARDHEDGEGEVAEQGADPAVQERGEQGRVQRPEDAGVLLDEFPAGEVEEVPHVASREPVLLLRGRLPANGLREGENRFPEVVEDIQHEAGLRVRDGTQFLQDGLHIRQVVHQIRQDDVVEGFAAGEVERVSDAEFELRMALLGELDHRGAEVHPDAAGGLHGGEGVAEAAADFEHALAGRDEEGEVAVEQRVVGALRLLDAVRGALLVEVASAGHAASGYRKQGGLASGKWEAARWKRNLKVATWVTVVTQSLCEDSLSLLSVEHALFANDLIELGEALHPSRTVGRYAGPASGQSRRGGSKNSQRTVCIASLVRKVPGPSRKSRMSASQFSPL
jgi:hypothetical protein